ncbi:MAG TPA: nucleotide disphospho-sugar-binding domain-containing protein, partial [Thermomicrobiaceae bacterium]|nr:nucleotide disphospho-sugar-binding domain-containing protein [Thermomicrobiaceae bacterium]
SDVPHSWLFPRMAAVVHHGGSGTTSQGLRAGVPTLIVPFIADQFYWGKRVQDLGVGCPPVRPSEIERTDLSYLIQELVESPSMRRRAEEVGRQIRSEDGVGRAVQLIEEYAERQGVHR